MSIHEISMHADVRMLTQKADWNCDGLLVHVVLLVRHQHQARPGAHIDADVVVIT